jgi:predicted metal-dependent phosphotriesterase family hydrolase
MKVRTVTGDITPEQIEKTLIHEHLVFDLSQVRQEKDFDSVLEDSMEMDGELTALLGEGCNTIVEVSNIGMGRNPKSLKDIAEKHQLVIIASTGFYKQSVYPPIAFEKTKEELADLMIKEVTVGMDDTDIKAGLIAEIGSSFQEITDTETKVFEAAIIAQKVTGAPLSTHCEIGTMGKEQLFLFEKWGADLKKISFGHQDLNTDIEEQLQLLSSGAYIQFDTIGKNSYRKDEDRLTNLLKLLDRGYEDQIMLSCDITRKSYMKRRGGHGYDHLFTSFVPKLIEQDVTEEIVDKMLIHNPRKFLLLEEAAN